MGQQVLDTQRAEADRIASAKSRRDQVYADLLRAAEALANGATGNGHNIIVSKAHLDRLMDTIYAVKTHG